MEYPTEILQYSDTRYPKLLRQIPQPPTTLFYRGDITLLTHKNLLAVVGSRKASAYGKEVCQTLLPPLVQEGIVLVSGLAYGIDGIAHSISVQSTVPTIAILGSGIDDASIYPKSHLGLAHKILHTGGVLISEYPEGTSPHPARFPARNRIIAGTSPTILVVQAAKRSGSLITARLGLETGRDVLAVPGPISDPVCEGTNMLIRDGAYPVLESNDILSFFQLKEKSHETQPQLRTFT